MDPFLPDPAGCRTRQRRLISELESLGIELAVLTQRESVQWLTGLYVPPLFETAAAITASGQVTLVAPERMASAPAAADERVGYPAKRLSTMVDRAEQAADCHRALLEALPAKPTGIGAELAVLGRTMPDAVATKWVDLSSTLSRLRRRKEADELRMMARANEANQAMYAEARRIVQPGMNELDLYCQLQAIAVRTLGEALTYFGQDFQSASRGGAPRDRRCQAGELLILDLGVGFRGFYSDNARTLAVGSEPTRDQQNAWQWVSEVFAMVESQVRPGLSCAQLFRDVQRLLAPATPWQFNHHLGHGVGLSPHEAPRLNPNWDDSFDVGDYFAVEPGLYHPDLNAGLRLEQNYVVTDRGVELLTPWPLEL